MIICRLVLYPGNSLTMYLQYVFAKFLLKKCEKIKYDTKENLIMVSVSENQGDNL